MYHGADVTDIVLHRNTLYSLRCGEGRSPSKPLAYSSKYEELIELKTLTITNEKKRYSLCFSSQFSTDVLKTSALFGDKTIIGVIVTDELSHQ